MAKKQKTTDAAWDTAHLQMVFFPVESPRELGQDWFAELVGQPPSKSILKPHEIVSVGPLGSLTLNVSVDLLKITFTLLPNLEQDTLTDGIPTLLMGLPDASDLMLGLMSKWIGKQTPAIKRVGFSGRMVQPTQDAKTGLAGLRKYLSTVKLDDTSSDLLYRINRPRPSKFGPTGLTLNRISTWMTVRTTLQVRMTTQGGESQDTEPRESFASCCEFDVNTSQEYTKELPRSKLKKILSELSDSAIEIASKGDIQ